MKRNKPPEPSSNVGGVSNRSTNVPPPRTNDPFSLPDGGNKKLDKTKPRGRLTKADIGAPTEFR